MRKSLIFLLLLVFLMFTSMSPRIASAVDSDLSIQPVAQRTPVWCWLAVGEMVFKHFDVPNVNPAGIYQCGIIGALAGPYHICWRDCAQCTVPAGNSQNITNMLLNYPRLAEKLTGIEAGGIRSSHVGRALRSAEIISELDDDRPIIAGISPAGMTGPFAQHVVLIVGYEGDEDDLTLIVNDPYPYQYVGNRSDPYLAAGAHGGEGEYRIELGTLKQRLHWTETFYKLRQDD